VKSCRVGGKDGLGKDQRGGARCQERVRKKKTPGEGATGYLHQRRKAEKKKLVLPGKKGSHRAA